MTDDALRARRAAFGAYAAQLVEVPELRQFLDALLRTGYHELKHHDPQNEAANGEFDLLLLHLALEWSEKR